jgi:hypothetical protein
MQDIRQVTSQGAAMWSAALSDIIRDNPISPPWLYSDQKYYQDQDYSWQEMRSYRPGVTLPKVIDVGVGSTSDPFREVWITAEDGQVYRTNFYVNPITPAGGAGLKYIAVSPNHQHVWCVATDGTLWRQNPAGGWLQAPAAGKVSLPLEDLTIDGSNSVWMTGQIGTIWMTSDGTSFQDATVLIGFKRLAVGSGDYSLWGIASNGSLWWHYRPTRTWYPTNGLDMEDLSVTYEGVVWLVDRSGRVWTTRDGQTLQPNPGTGFRRISAGRYSVVYGVKTDGTLWMWAITPSAPPSQGGGGGGGGAQTVAAAPTVNCSTSGADVFTISGSGFMANSQVTIKGANILYGQVNNVYWTTSASSTGTINQSLTIPCVPGVQINFSATDGRSNPNDWTGKLWSNPVTCSCPA